MACARIWVIHISASAIIRVFTQSFALIHTCIPRGSQKFYLSGNVDGKNDMLTELLHFRGSEAGVSRFVVNSVSRLRVVWLLFVALKHFQSTVKTSLATFPITPGTLIQSDSRAISPLTHLLLHALLLDNYITCLIYLYSYFIPILKVGGGSSSCCVARIV